MGRFAFVRSIVLFETCVFKDIPSYLLAAQERMISEAGGQCQEKFWIFILDKLDRRHLYRTLLSFVEFLVAKEHP